MFKKTKNNYYNWTNVWKRMTTLKNLWSAFSKSDGCIFPFENTWKSLWKMFFRLSLVSIRVMFLLIYSTRVGSGHPIFGYYWAFSEENTRPPFQILKMSIVDSKPKKKLKLTGSLNFCFSEIRGFSLIFSQCFDNLYLLL